MRRLFQTVSLAMLAVNTALMAEPSRAIEPTPSEQVVVTAARVPLRAAMSGAGVTVITREEIERRRPQFVTELLRDVPGFSVSRSGGNGAYTQVRVRGAESNHLLVLIDGVEANDFSQNDDFDFGLMQASEIERIEIVRGPQSALWGSDALAGVINIITRKARRARDVSLTAEFGSLGTQFYSGAIGTARESYHARVGLSHSRTTGVNVSSRGTEDDGNRNSTVNFKLGWEPLAAMSLDLHGRVTDAETELDSPDFTDGLNRDIDSTTDTTQAYVGGKAEWRAFGGQWTHALTGGWTKLDNATRNPDFGGLTRTRGRKYSLDYQSTARATSQVLTEVNHAFTGAIDYDLEEFAQRGPITFGDPNQDRRRHTLGYVLEYRANFEFGLSLGVSGRWDDNSDFADIGTYRVSFAQAFEATGTTLLASYGTGHKAPTFTERYGFFASGGFLPFIGNPSLQPEQSHGYEIGVRQAFWARRAEVGVTYFNEHLTDEIDGTFFVPATASLTAVNRSGTSKRRGVEINGRVDFTPNIGVHGTYTYLDATEENGGLRLDEIRRPRHQGSLGVFWKGCEEKLSFDAGVSRSGQRADLAFLPPVFGSRVNLTPYTLGHVSAEYRLTPMLAVTARLENAFDDEYEEVFDFQNEGVNALLGLKFEL